MYSKSGWSSSRLHWIIVVGAFLAAVALIFFKNESFYRDFLSYAPQASLSRSASTVRLTVDWGNGTRRAFLGETNAGMTILSALRAAQSAGKFSLATDSRGAIVDIAGVRNSAAQRWRIYRNEAAVSDLPGHIEIEPGDRILLYYE